MRIQLDLHARSHPAADWRSQLLSLQTVLEIEGAYPVPRQQPVALQAAAAALDAARKRVKERRGAERAPLPAQTQARRLLHMMRGAGSSR